MAENEALKILKRDLAIQIENKALPDGINAITTAIQALEEVQAYRAIGTIKELQALKEKNEPKKPIVQGLGQRYCPVCKCGGANHFYCTRCGQKLG